MKGTTPSGPPQTNRSLVGRVGEDVADQPTVTLVLFKGGLGYAYPVAGKRREALEIAERL